MDKHFDKQTLAELRFLEKWRKVEPGCRGYEARFSSTENGMAWALTFWSLKEGSVSRWGVITGYGPTLRAAHEDAIQKRRERIPGFETA